MPGQSVKNAPVETHHKRYNREVTCAIIAHVLICVVVGVVMSIKW